MKSISKFILWLLGWKIHGGIPEGEKKAVIVAAPHTSNWDFFLGRFAYFVMEVNAKFLIKKEAFKWPLGGLFKAWGGIPIDRSRSSNMVEQVAGLFHEHESLYIVITPEGTRSLVSKWKKGFYYIALRAKVPIALAYIDYKKKEGGIGPTIHPSGDYEKDLARIEDFYKDKTARYPGKFNLSPQNRNKKNSK
ncbi:MAG: lysophospholipid acyltransferase family protein [Bacteroidales bacterium]|nr:lysophospholipid acyltransferase family protein [Bacteroidales bacterium]MCF8343292.1 lysophospholipid acyltransferase family protein [Bacteroidales bacterium]MCF8351651.1 lysophospholipid acyltransferase family protein [Bacteroidales bacterium]MCF8375526.1 lysophospholipid acyltransferase family protein [Bacteroidales bacterium]MCF8399925.1 lysophospholipid acyltransferase family protein [Bacteroidales bacterium]